ncbi:MAG: (2E,6E)-farnesyl diphosphate synthase [Gammaproteobacteria bacterium]|nr:(2E,6E)-farnesyl diphosphate synthase [Gammaproteobacteria bacterium]
MQDFTATLSRYGQRVERALEHWLPPADRSPTRLHEAMRYAALAPGKRLRPTLVYAAGGALGAAPELLDAPAAAVELIHAYSLVHDDLPAMDDDDLRRGRPTCHKAYDEATAILVGDGLQTLAFEVLAQGPACDDATRVAMLATLATASGSAGMVGGQALDLAATGQRLALAALEQLHLCKTGALIRASIRLGVLAAGAGATPIATQLDHYGRCLGLAFQVQDDILDVVGDTAVLGKPQGSDEDNDKSTYPALLGLEGARAAAEALHAEALANLANGAVDFSVLRALADYVITRQK